VANIGNIAKKAGTFRKKLRRFILDLLKMLYKQLIESVVISSHSIMISAGIGDCSIQGYRIVSSLHHGADADVLHISPRRIRIPKYSFSQLIGDDLINLLLRVIGLIHALGQYTDTENHDDDGHHQDNKKDYAGFILFELRKHIL